MPKPITPVELLPDNTNTIHSNGIEIRKGTIGACLYNANLLAQEITEEERRQILSFFIETAPLLNKTFDWNKHLSWNNPVIQEIFLQATHIKL